MTSESSLITQDPQLAAKWLKQGKLLAYPTESVWGIGCDPYNKQAVIQVLKIKNRPVEKGMIVVTDSVDRIASLLKYVPDDTRQSLISSWQDDSQLSISKCQAHTWLLPLSNVSKSDIGSGAGIPKWITGNHDSVAIRVISHPMIQSLCQHMVSSENPYGLIVSTSCNPSGETPASTFKQAYSYFNDSVGYLQGQTLGYTLPSQIKNALTGAIIR